jgi:hypothetical protein
MQQGEEIGKSSNEERKGQLNNHSNSHDVKTIWKPRWIPVDSCAPNGSSNDRSDEPREGHGALR